MHRKPLIKQLEAYQDCNQDEARTVERMLAFVRREKACFERSTLEGHVTGSAWIESADGERVLLLLHRKLGRWLQPGGHADGEADIARVARREAREETGLVDLRVRKEIFDLDIHQIPRRGAEPAHLHYDVRYRMVASARQQARINDESLDLRWYLLRDVAAWDHQPSVCRMAHKSLQIRVSSEPTGREVLRK